MLTLILTCLLMSQAEPRTAKEAVSMLARQNAAVGGFECEVSLYYGTDGQPERLESVSFYRQETDRSYVRALQGSDSEVGRVTAYDGERLRHGDSICGSVQRLGREDTQYLRRQYSPWALVYPVDPKLLVGGEEYSPESPGFKWGLGGTITVDGTRVLRLECHWGHWSQVTQTDPNRFWEEKGLYRQYFLDPAKGYTPMKAEEFLKPDRPTEIKITYVIDKWEKTAEGIWFPVEGRAISSVPGHTSTRRIVVTPGTLKVKQHYSDADFRPVWRQGITISNLETGTTKPYDEATGAE